MNRVRQLAALALAGLVLTGCAAADVVKKYSRTSFAAIVEAFPGLVTDDGTAYTLTIDGGTKLRVAKNYSKTDEDILLDAALAPFTEAGLDPAKLGEGYRVDGERLLVTGDFGEGSDEKGNLTDALLAAVDAERMALSYHQALDHYGIGLPGGKFEYAKDYKTNDKDVVFVLYADPLAQAGAKVENIEGWVYMTMEGEDGSKTNVLLQPFDLTE